MSGTTNLNYTYAYNVTIGSGGRYYIEKTPLANTNPGTGETSSGAVLTDTIGADVAAGTGGFTVASPNAQDSTGAGYTETVTYLGTYTDAAGNVFELLSFTDLGVTRVAAVSDASESTSGYLTAQSPSQNLVFSCFMPGTLVATPTGETAIETLQAGDIVTLADGGTASITWVGRQTVVSMFTDKLRSSPIRVKAGALEDGIPSRDLLVSPDHALLVDGVLVHAGALVNGVSIVRETALPARFTYYHVEIAGHELLLAENTPAETFIDNAGRLAFDNWAEHPGADEIVEMDLPRAKSARQVPPSTRKRLLARAGVETEMAA